jgi:hypothetical protein
MTNKKFTASSLFAGLLAAAIYGCFASFSMPSWQAVTAGSFLAAVLLGYVLTTALYPASDRSYSAITVAQLNSIMKSMDLCPRINQNPKSREIYCDIGDFCPMLAITMHNKLIVFRCCTEDHTASLEDINKWHMGYRYSRSYLDDEGDPNLELELDLDGGVCEERIRDFLDTCMKSIELWNSQVLKKKK